MVGGGVVCVQPNKNRLWETDKGCQRWSRPPFFFACGEVDGGATFEALI